MGLKDRAEQGERVSQGAQLGDVLVCAVVRAPSLVPRQTARFVGLGSPRPCPPRRIQQGPELNGGHGATRAPTVPESLPPNELRCAPDAFGVARRTSDLCNRDQGWRRRRRRPINHDQMQGKWERLKGSADKLYGTIQRRFGDGQEEVGRKGSSAL